MNISQNMNTTINMNELFYLIIRFSNIFFLKYKHTLRNFKDHTTPTNYIKKINQHLYSILISRTCHFALDRIEISQIWSGHIEKRLGLRGCIGSRGLKYLANDPSRV